MYWSKTCLLLLAALCLAFPISTVNAEPSPTAQVRTVLDKAMEIQTRPDLQGTEKRSERSSQIRKLIADNFLSSEMAKESLDGHWERLSAKQREQYQTLFIGLFEDSYTRRVLNFLQKETIEYPGESPEGKYTRVGTIIMRTNEHIPVDYILEKKGQKWFIRDIYIDGVGIVETYKNSFGRFLQTKPFDALIQRMVLQKKAGEVY